MGLVHLLFRRRRHGRLLGPGVMVLGLELGDRAVRLGGLCLLSCRDGTAHRDSIGVVLCALSMGGRFAVQAC